MNFVIDKKTGKRRELNLKNKKEIIEYNLKQYARLKTYNGYKIVYVQMVCNVCKVSFSLSNIFPSSGKRYTIKCPSAKCKNNVKLEEEFSYV